MPHEIITEGFTELEECLKTLQEKLVFVLFTGSIGDDGKSWCPDCVAVEDVIKSSLIYLPPDSTFIQARVGAREFWKDKENPFRISMKIKCVPTLVKWGTVLRLEENECGDIELLKLLYGENE